MKQLEKIQVRDAMLRYLSSQPKGADAARELQGVDANVIKKIKDNELSAVPDACWAVLAKQVGFYCGDWQAADTGAYMLLKIIFNDAKNYSLAYGVSIAEGLGKTFAAQCYLHSGANTYYIAGNEAYNRKTFVGELLKNFSNTIPATVPAMMQLLSEKISAADEPLIIIDDAHKLKDRVFFFLATVMDSLKGMCGIVLVGNDSLRKRILAGVDETESSAAKANDSCKAMYGMIGRRFITLSQAGPSDVELICRANGVNDEHRIAFIKEQCPGELYGIKELVQAIKEKIAA